MLLHDDFDDVHTGVRVLLVQVGLSSQHRAVGTTVGGTLVEGQHFIRVLDHRLGLTKQVAKEPSTVGLQFERALKLLDFFWTHLDTREALAEFGVEVGSTTVEAQSFWTGGFLVDVCWDLEHLLVEVIQVVRLQNQVNAVLHVDKQLLVRRRALGLSELLALL